MSVGTRACGGFVWGQCGLWRREVLGEVAVVSPKGNMVVSSGKGRMLRSTKGARQFENACCSRHWHGTTGRSNITRDAMRFEAEAEGYGWTGSDFCGDFWDVRSTYCLYG